MKLFNIPYRNIITSLQDHIQTKHVVTPMYASSSNSLWGEQLSLNDHVHTKYVKKELYKKVNNYFTTSAGYYYDYAKAINSVSYFADRYHNHDDLYVYLGSTIEAAYSLVNYNISELAAIDHTHDEYATLTTIFETAQQLELYTSEHFALSGHMHDDTYYKKEDSVANAEYLQITTETGNLFVYSKEDLAEKIHFHSYYLSIIEADKSLVPIWAINSLLYEYYLSPVIVSSVATAKISNAVINTRFSAPVLTWYSSTTSGSPDIPAALNTNLVKLSSYTLHQYITPPSVTPLKLIEKDTNNNDKNYISVNMTTNVANSTSQFTILDTYISPGRAVVLYIDKRSDIAPIVLNITQPVVDSGNEDPLAVSIFTAVSDVIVTEPDPNNSGQTISVHKWQLLIYRYNVPHSNLVQNHVRLAVIA